MPGHTKSEKRKNKAAKMKKSGTKKGSGHKRK